MGGAEPNQRWACGWVLRDGWGESAHAPAGQTRSACPVELGWHHVQGEPMWCQLPVRFENRPVGIGVCSGCYGRNIRWVGEVRKLRQVMSAICVANQYAYARIVSTADLHYPARQRAPDTIAARRSSGWEPSP